jgi:hypothetical protein
VLERSYAPPRDRLFLKTDDARVLALADRLWVPAPKADGEPVLWVTVETFDGPAPEALAERRLAWTLGEDAYEVRIEGLLSARMDLARGATEARVSRALLAAAPALAARYLLEVTSAVFLSRRAWHVLHAGAVVGRNGAVVLRGGSGAGKSTLVAAALKVGLGVLADESLLVAREDSDELASSVRDLTLLPPGAELAGNFESQPAFSGGEEKRRIDLFTTSTPASRHARRVATFLLGPRVPGPARLVSLSRNEFMAEFGRGGIREERLASDPDSVGLDWHGRNGFRLDGASDIPGAVDLIEMHAGRATHATRGASEMSR